MPERLTQLYDDDHPIYRSTLPLFLFYAVSAYSIPLVALSRNGYRSWRHGALPSTTRGFTAPQLHTDR